MLIREIEMKDAEHINELIKKVESEAEYMLMGAGERQTTPEQQRTQVEQILGQENSTILVAEEDKLVGYLLCMGGSAARIRHSAYLVIGIVREYRGKGIGTKLFQALDQWAKSKELTRLELTVVSKNEPGIALYKKSGFEMEGTKRQSLKVDGVYHDEYVMARIL